MVVPFPAGGPTDTLARILADRMTASLGQSIVLENVSGASGSVGLGRVARAAPDGYTLIIGHWATHVVIRATMNLPYDVLNDFEPVTLLADTPIWLVARNNLPALNLSELITWLKQNPGKALAGAVGVGGASDLNATYFEKVTGTKFQLVPYLGAAPLNQDLLAGRIDLFLGMAAATFPFVRSGQMKAYAVMARSRWWAAPEVPTMEEEGVPDSTLHFGMDYGCQRNIEGYRRATEFRGTVGLGQPRSTAALCRSGPSDPPPDQQTPEALGKLQKAEMEKWWPIIMAAGIKAE